MVSSMDKDKVDRIAREHAEWFQSVFSQMIELVFYEAFKHGYKHGYEDGKKEMNKDE